MLLRQPEWARNVLALQQQEQEGKHRQVTELVVALSDQRVYREVVWSLKRGLRDARSEFSFVRWRGLNALAKFIASASGQEKMLELFRDCQSSYRELQVVPVLFDYTLAPRKRLVKKVAANSGVESSPTSVEVALGLRVLEGCCLLYSGCRAAASHHAAVSELVDLFLAGGASVQGHCLDGLLALMLESPSNQKEFKRVHGLRKIGEMLRNNHLDPVIRSKGAWMSKWAQQEVVELLGEESSAVVEAMIDAGQSHPLADQEEQQTATLHYAHQLLHLATSS